MPATLTEEQVVDRLAGLRGHGEPSSGDALHVAAVLEGYYAGIPLPKWSRALRAVGVRWTGTHYEEAGE